MTTTPIHWLDRARVAEARVAELEAALTDVRDCMGGDDPAQGWDNPGAVWGIATKALGAVSDG